MGYRFFRISITFFKKKNDSSKKKIRNNNHIPANISILNRTLLKKQSIFSQNIYMFWDGRIRTSEQRDQNPLPYHLATPHLDFYSILRKYIACFVCLSTLVQISIEQIRLVLGFCDVFGMCRYRIQLNLLIITYNSIKILYENMIFSILL